MPIQQITTGIIADGAITVADVADATITGAKLAANTVTGNKIGQNAISSNNIVSVNASVATVGTLPSARLPAGSIVQLKTKLGSLSRFSSSSASWVEVDSSIRISLTPTKADNLILVHMSCHVNLNEISQISVLPTFSTNAGTTFQSMIAEKDSAGGLAASSVISTSGSMNEHFRSLSGNAIWAPHTIHAIITASSTTEHLFSTHAYVSTGSMNIGDNGNEHRITVMEIAV